MKSAVFSSISEEAGHGKGSFLPWSLPVLLSWPSSFWFGRSSLISWVVLPPSRCWAGLGYLLTSFYHCKGSLSQGNPWRTLVLASAERREQIRDYLGPEEAKVAWVDLDGDANGQGIPASDAIPRGGIAPA